MKQWARKQTGFTIVELLIVVVVIAILAAITIVAYNGIKERAVVSTVQNALSQANKKVLTYAAGHADTYPATLADAGVRDTDTVSYQYTSDNGAGTYAITASTSTVSFYLSKAQPSLISGVAPGHNISVWDKKDNSTAPVTGHSEVTVDTSVFRTSTASLRIAPQVNSRSIRVSPINGVAGQTVTVSFWMRSDSNWNGTINNSKIRFGSAVDGSLLTSCSYNGVKTTWSFVTCSRVLGSNPPAVAVAIGNDGTIGNIWIDDFSVVVQ